MFGNDDFGSLNLDSVSVEETLMDSDVSRHHDFVGSRKPLNWGGRLMLIVFLLGFLGIVTRLYGLQIAQGSYYRLQAEGNRVRNIPQFAPRGLILDRYGEIIARNVPSFELAVIPQDLPKDAERANLLSKVAEVIKMPALELEAAVTAAEKRGLVEPVAVKQSLEQSQALALSAIVGERQGFRIQTTPIREYLNAPAFAHLVGYVGKLNQEEWENKRAENYFFNDVIGKAGLELIYEERLRGKSGSEQYEVDASGEVLRLLRKEASAPGQDLRLTVDAGLQNVLYSSLAGILGRTPGATGAAAVAMDPRSGEILSLVSLPSFDNNLFARGIGAAAYAGLVQNERKPMLNRSIGGVYPPGSTLKPVIAAAALEEKVITEKTIINDEGYIQVGSYTFRGWDRDGLGPVNVVSAISKSSNPFFYIVGGGHESYDIEGLGVERIVRYLKAFGMGEKLGINLPGEAAGFVPTPEWKKERFAGTDEENWYLGNTYAISIGQGDLLVTPLQIAAYTAAIANGGTLYVPKFSELEAEKVIRNLGLNGQSLEWVRRGMEENVLTGSGVRLRDLPVTAAGKTGTAQFSAADLSKTHAWYTGYAPAEVPEIVITVLVEAGGEGHAVAVPVVREALEFWATNRR